MVRANKVPRPPTPPELEKQVKLDATPEEVVCAISASAMLPDTSKRVIRHKNAPARS